jgi:PAS domain S-box-containing protein
MSPPIRILYIDDSPLDRELVRDALEKEHAGFELVITASRRDFEIALAKGGFDLILSDFNILGFEGLQVIDAVHAVDPDLPVVIVTGTGSEEIAIETMKRGAADYVIKTPIHILRLPKTIQDVLEIKRQKARRVQAEEALAQEQLLLGTLMENIPDKISVKDAQGRFIRINPATARSFGLEHPDQAIGKTDFDFFKPESAQAYRENEQVVVRTGQPVLNQEEEECWLDRPSTWALTSYMPQRDPAGHITGTFCISRDITGRRQAEELRRESERRMSSIYDAVGDVIFYLEVENGGQYRFISVNPSFYRVTGLSQEQIVGKRASEVIPEPSLGMVLGKYRQAIETRTIVHWEEISDYPAGRLIGEVSVAPVLDDNGRCTHLVGSVHDITARKQAEEALRQSEERYRGLFENAAIGIFHSLPEGRFLRVNPALARMIGYASPEEMVTSVTDLRTQIYVDSKKHTQVLESTLEKDGWVYTENRYRRKDGSILTANLAVRQVLNPDGSLAYLEGMVEDITTQKKAEESLRNSEERYREMFENMSSGVVV